MYMPLLFVVFFVVVSFFPVVFFFLRIMVNKTIQLIYTKFGGKLSHVPRKNLLDFDGYYDPAPNSFIHSSFITPKQHE